MAYTDIDKPTDYFNTNLWTGNGSTQSITGVGFQPDWVWIKSRTGTYSGSDHHIYDVIRGANVKLSSNSNGGDSTISDTLTSFDSDGYSLGYRTRVNGTGTTYVGWNWLAGGTASSNTDGSITSSVSASTTSGFSIVSYTGSGSNATIGHGLGTSDIGAIIFKNRSDTEGWKVYHKSLGATKNLNFNETGGSQTQSGAFNDTEPTSSVFSVGTFNSTNGSSDNMIAYCFAEKKGFSKMGSYVGNGSSNGSFIHLGFQPAWFLTKKTSASGTGWFIFDNKRDPLNPNSKFLMVQASNSEDDNTNRGMDFLSNGIKIRGTNGDVNESGSTYAYMAFAESPFVSSSGIPTTAR
jgi:hypothetical protein